MERQLAKKRATIRVDAGRRIGFGHLSRCIALAIKLKELGIEVQFLSRENPALSEILGREGFKVTFVPHDIDEEIKFLADFVKTNRIDTFVIDSKRNLPIRFALKIRDAGSRFVLIDNQNEVCGHVDLLVLPGFKEQFSSYQDKVGNTEVLIGSKYVILNKHFPVRIARARKDKLQVIVSMGGSDKFMLTERVVGFLQKASEDFECKVIIGRFKDYTPRVSDSRFELVNHVPNLPSFMAASDIGIISMGITAYEAAACGLPSLVVSHSYENLRAAKVLERNAVCKSVGHRNNLDQKSFIASFSSFVRNASLRQQMGEAGRQLVDGLGASRVAEHIASNYT